MKRYALNLDSPRIREGSDALMVEATEGAWVKYEDADQLAQRNLDLRLALVNAYTELDDLLEDWQLEGRHSEPRYKQLKCATEAVREALK